MPFGNNASDAANQSIRLDRAAIGTNTLIWPDIGGTVFGIVPAGGAGCAVLMAPRFSVSRRTARASGTSILMNRTIASGGNTFP